MQPSPSDQDFSSRIYRWRWGLSLLVVAMLALVVASGFGRVAQRTDRLARLGDNAGGLPPQPLLFDPRMDIWFGIGDPAVEAYRHIEDEFVAEDYVVVAFEEKDDELGVFGRRSLETVARLTEAMLRIPGVRHVRSLTSAPWIRWDTIEGDEEGLIVSDLVDMPAETIPHMTDDELLERMIAVLGAARAAERVGEERVRDVLGPDARFENHLGEPLMLGTIVDEDARVTSIQVQVLRGRVDDELFHEVFPNGAGKSETAPALFSVQTQHRALRGIEHVLRVEQGRAVPTDELARLRESVAAQPLGAERTRLEFELEDPTRNFVALEDGQLVRKYHEYDQDGAGWIDRSDPAHPVAGPDDFEPQAKSPYRFHVVGMPPFERNFMEVGMADSKFMGLVLLLIVLVLAAVYRSVLGVAGPMIVVLASVLGMVGAVLAMGDLFNNLTAIAPNMLVAVGIADAIHLVSSYSVLRHRYDTRERVLVEVLRRNALPVFLTSVTTAVGFYSLTVSEIGPMGQLGYTAGLGALIAYTVSMSLLPALLSLLPLPKSKDPGHASHEPGRLCNALADWVLGHRVRILAALGLLIAVTLAGLARFQIDTDFRAMFPDDNRVMSDFHWVEDRLGGVGDLEIVFTGPAPTEEPAELEEARARLADLHLRSLGHETAPEEFAALDASEQTELARLEESVGAADEGRIAANPAFYDSVERFERRLLEEMQDEASPMRVVTDLTSPLDVLRKMHQVQNENAGSFYRVPGEADVAPDAREPKLFFDEWSEEWSLLPGQDASNLIAQYFLQYENGARPGENLSTQISADRRSFRMQGRVRQAPTNLQKAAFERIAEIAEIEFPELAASVSPSLAGTTVSGKTVLFSRTPIKFTWGFIESMGLALLVITLIIGLIFRSPGIALVSIVPNLLPILIPLAVIGLTGRPLDGPAILVASVGLGVCVDDTIHFFAKFTKARRMGMDVRSALVFTYDQVGRAITTTSVVLVMGFAGLTFSDFRPNYMMGTLATVMFSLAWIADIIVTPALLSFLPEKSPAPVTEPVATSGASA